MVARLVRADRTDYNAILSQIIMNCKRPASQLALAALFLAAATSSILAQTSAPTRALQQLTNDLALQLELAYRHDLPTHQARYEEMAQALAAWNRSHRTDADYVVMEQWLRSAIRSSMAGSGQPLPALPQFAVPQSVVAERPIVTPSEDAAPKSVVAKPKATPPVVATKPKQTAVPPDSVDPAPVAVRPAPRDFWTRHPASRPIDTSNPFRDDPVPTSPKPATVAAAAPTVKPAAEPPTVRTAMRLPVIEAADVAVNLPELSARINGYNQSLRRIEAAVIAADKPEADELAKLLAALEQIHDQRDFIDLYVIGLTPTERAATPKLDASDAVLSLIEEKIGDRLGSAAAIDNSKEREVVQALAQKLAELQRKLPESP